MDHENNKKNTTNVIETSTSNRGSVLEENVLVSKVRTLSPSRSPASGTSQPGWVGAEEPIWPIPLGYRSLMVPSGGTGVCPAAHTCQSVLHWISKSL
eukprot:4415571-Amphidinium_carterae.1